MARALVADDDGNIRELVGRSLSHLGLECAYAADGREALDLLAPGGFDLVVLDLMMPKVDGISVCAAAKRRAKLPVLVLTALGAVERKVALFEAGADDYVVKPFDPDELAARAKALLRRYAPEAALVAEVGDLVLDRRRYEVRENGRVHTIPPKEFELLFKLASSPGVAFTRDQILRSVWGEDFVGVDRTVDVHVNRIRERFPEAQHGYKIGSIRGLGYRLEAQG